MRRPGFECCLKPLLILPAQLFETTSSSRPCLFIYYLQRRLLLLDIPFNLWICLKLLPFLPAQFFETSLSCPCILIMCHLQKISSCAIVLFNLRRPAVLQSRLFEMSPSSPCLLTIAYKNFQLFKSSQLTSDVLLFCLNSYWNALVLPVSYHSLLTKISSFIIVLF